MSERLCYLYFDGDDSVLVGNFLDFQQCDIIGDVVHRTLEEFKATWWYSHAVNQKLYTDEELIKDLGLVKPKKLQIVTVYTDGSAAGKTKLGGIGVYMYTEVNGKRYESRTSKGYSNTKIGRMELTAIITALELIHVDKRASTKVVIKSDSMYAVNCVAKKWMWRWKLEIGGLQGRANGDLLQQLFDIYHTYPNGHVHISHVKGHNGDAGNEEADRLAGLGFKSGSYIKDLP